MTNDLRDTDTNEMVPYERDDNVMTKVKSSMETNESDNDFLREYDQMHQSMEDRQIIDLYEAQRHLQSAMKGDTQMKTVQNRQHICDAARVWGGPRAMEHTKECLLLRRPGC